MIVARPMRQAHHGEDRIAGQTLSTQLHLHGRLTRLGDAQFGQNEHVHLRVAGLAHGRDQLVDHERIGGWRPHPGRVPPFRDARLPGKVDGRCCGHQAKSRAVFSCGLNRQRQPPISGLVKRPKAVPRLGHDMSATGQRKHPRRLIGLAQLVERPRELSEHGGAGHGVMRLAVDARERVARVPRVVGEEVTVERDEHLGECDPAVHRTFCPQLAHPAVQSQRRRVECDLREILHPVDLAVDLVVYRLDVGSQRSGQQHVPRPWRGRRGQRVEQPHRPVRLLRHGTDRSARHTGRGARDCA